MVGTGLFYYGTDGHGDTLEDRFYRSDVEGRVIKYQGDRPNEDHSFHHRRTHHLPLFRRKADELDSPYLVEWWLTEADSGRPGDDRYDFETVVHLPIDNDYLRGLLDYWRMDLENLFNPPPMQITQDLPDPVIDWDVTVETRMPNEETGSDPIPLDIDQWESAHIEATQITKVLEKLTNDL